MYEYLNFALLQFCLLVKFLASFYEAYALVINISTPHPRSLGYIKHIFFSLSSD